MTSQKSDEIARISEQTREEFSTNDNVIISHRAYKDPEDYKAQRQQILQNIQEGQVFEGIVRSITDYGIFVGLVGSDGLVCIDGLVHMSEITWDRSHNPSKSLHIGQKVNVIVIQFDKEKAVIKLSLKRVRP